MLATFMPINLSLPKLGSLPLCPLVIHTLAEGVCLAFCGLVHHLQMWFLLPDWPGGIIWQAACFCSAHEQIGLRPKLWASGLLGLLVLTSLLPLSSPCCMFSILVYSPGTPGKQLKSSLWTFNSLAFKEKFQMGTPDSGHLSNARLLPSGGTAERHCQPFPLETWGS